MSRASTITWHLLRWPIWVCVALSALLCYAAFDINKLQKTMETRYGYTGLIKLKAWQQLIDANQSQSDVEKIKLTNNFFNKNIRFEEDIVHWKKMDYWATPLESLGSGAGDCEDFTIAKYMTLIKMGIATEHLRLIYVKAKIGGKNSHVFQAHMVLGYFADAKGEPVILDNLVSAIEPASQRTDLYPIFSFNSEGLWIGNQTQTDPTARLSRWRDLLARMKDEGF